MFKPTGRGRRSDTWVTLKDEEARDGGGIPGKGNMERKKKERQQSSLRLLQMPGASKAAGREEVTC